MTNPIVQQLADAIRGAVGEVDDRFVTVAVSLYGLLTQGEPVSAEAIVADTGIDEPGVRDTLDRMPSMYRDEAGRVIGWGGLSIRKMDHRFHATGGQPIYAWCALDPFLIVPLLGRSARVESRDPITGELVTMTVTPEGVEDLSPAGAMVSFIVPDGPFDNDVIETFCHYVMNFASRETAERFASEHCGIVLLPVDDAFEVGRRAWSVFRKRTQEAPAAG